MAVMVRQPSGDERRYPDAHGFLLRDNGHLAVVETMFQNATVFAVYAPGQWVYAEQEPVEQA